MQVPDELVHGIEGYEYNIMYRWTDPEVIERLGSVWEYSWTNRFSDEAWYPNEKSVKNAMAQIKATRYGYSRADRREYKIVRRPYGAVEDV